MKCDGMGWDGLDWIGLDWIASILTKRKGKGHEKKGKGKRWVRSRRRVGGEERRGGRLLSCVGRAA